MTKKTLNCVVTSSVIVVIVCHELNRLQLSKSIRTSCSMFAIGHILCLHKPSVSELQKAHQKVKRTLLNTTKQYDKTQNKLPVVRELNIERKLRPMSNTLYVLHGLTYGSTFTQQQTSHKKKDNFNNNCSECKINRNCRYKGTPS